MYTWQSLVFLNDNMILDLPYFKEVYVIKYHCLKLKDTKMKISLVTKDDTCAKVILHIIAVFAFPPSAGCKMRVSLLSR